jgi:hypothetical protein
MIERDWRSPDAYKPLQTLSREAIGWEFLRRNPQYRAVYEQRERPGEKDGDDPPVRKWGLSFPASARPRCGRVPGVLAARCRGFPREACPGA